MFSVLEYGRLGIFIKEKKTPTKNFLLITLLQHKKTEHNIYNKINKKVIIIASNYGFSERVGFLAKSNAFISSKDDKPNFKSNKSLL